MKINFATIQKNEKLVTIDPSKVSVNIELAKVKEYYLTPLQAILFGIVQKHGVNGWVEIPSSINGCFMHFEGGHDINEALDMLVEKRLIIEAEYFCPIDTCNRVFKLADI